MLRIMKLNAGYRNSVVVQDLSLEIGRGEVVAIIGPNGSGKSTLLKSVFGLAKIFSGYIEFDGFNIQQIGVEMLPKMGLGYVPQNRNVFSSMSVLENLELGLIPLGDVHRRSSRLDSVFSLFPALFDRRKQRTDSLSGGERQMLAIARAFIPGPKMIMLDEPTANLSPKLASQVYTTISSMRKEGATIVLVEQNARAALANSDRAFVLISGRKAFEGLSNELIDNPELVRLYLGRESARSP